MIYDPNMAGSVNTTDGAGLALRKSIILESITDTSDELEDNKATVAYYKENLENEEWKCVLNTIGLELANCELTIISGEERGVDVTELIGKFKKAVDLFESPDGIDDKTVSEISMVLAGETRKVNKLIEELDNE